MAPTNEPPAYSTAPEEARTTNSTSTVSDCDPIDEVATTATMHTLLAELMRDGMSLKYAWEVPFDDIRTHISNLLHTQNVKSDHDIRRDLQAVEAIRDFVMSRARAHDLRMKDLLRACSAELKDYGPSEAGLTTEQKEGRDKKRLECMEPYFNIRMQLDTEYRIIGVLNTVIARKSWTW